MIYERIIEEAYDNGITDAETLWHKTPNEINGRFRAEKARRIREIEHMDRLAWMMGHYVAHAFHSPQKYPRDVVFTKNLTAAEEMTDEEMQIVMHENMLRVSGSRR